MSEIKEKAQKESNTVVNVTEIATAIMSVVAAYWTLLAALVSVVATVATILLPKDAPEVVVQEDSAEVLPRVSEPCVVLV